MALALVSVTLLAQPSEPAAEGASDGGVPSSDGGLPAEPDVDEPHESDPPPDGGLPAEPGDGSTSADGGASSGVDAGAATEADDYEPLAEPLASCVRAFRAGQKLRRGAQLLASRDKLVVCAHPRCPAILSDKCVQWLREVDAAMPSVLIAATDPQGRETALVRVTADGRAVRERLDGRPVSLDPGDHVLRFEHPGSPVQRRWVVLSEGEPPRRIELRFSTLPTGWRDPIPPPIDAVTEPSASVSPWALGSFGVAGAGLLVGTITGIVAMNDLAEIERSCPDDVCPTDLQDDFDDAATLAHVSTGSFVVAGVGAAVGLVALVADLLADEDPSGGEAERTGPGIEAAVGPGAALLWGWF